MAKSRRVDLRIGRFPDDAERRRFRRSEEMTFS